MHDLRIAVALFGWCISAVTLAAEQKPIEEIIVTAQRIEEPASKVPMSVSAFTDAMIRDRQIVGISDLQMHVPNFSYSQELNFGAKISIRGIADSTYDIRRRSYTNPSVPVYINGVNAPSFTNVVNFYDLERLEVLRGPQSTLYGRTATAGAINIMTRMPDFEGPGGYLEAQYGDYDHRQLEGAFNWQVSDQLAVRAAGLLLERDGYIENKAGGSVPGIDDDLDDRDFNSVRLTGLWRPADTTSVWVLYTRFREDDSRVRIHNQVCQTSEFAVRACTGEFGLDPVHPSAVVNTHVAANVGAIPRGAYSAETGLVYEFPRPELNLRQQHTDLNPIFELDEDVWVIGAQQDFGNWSAEFYGSYLESDLLSRQDANLDVGPIMNPTPQNPGGLWPTSAPIVEAPCELDVGQTGVVGGCTLNDNLDRVFSYEQVDNSNTDWSAEFRFRSHFDGRFNVLLGGSYLESDVDWELYGGSNARDIVGLYGFALSGGTQLYPTLGYTNDKRDSNTYSAFADARINLGERLQLTGGLRYIRDKQSGRLRGSLIEAINLTPAPDGTLGPVTTWVRSSMLGFFAGNPSDEALFLADRYDATEAIQHATSFDELRAALQLVPITRQPGEIADFFGDPTTEKWDEVTYRLALDWSVTDGVLLYASFNQGYRPGGLDVNPAIPEFEPETVDAYELGAKTLWADGRLRINAALFFNDYHDMQLLGLAAGFRESTRFAAETFIDNLTGVDNVGAETAGLELEVEWRPNALPGLSVELSYAWLHSELDSKLWVDTENRTQGDPDVIELKAFNKTAFRNYVAPVAEVLPHVPAAIDAGAALPFPGSVYENGIPSFMTREFLESVGVATVAGVPVDIGGNQMANAPEHSVGLGLAHAWYLNAGTFALRWDYYWQDASFAREFNSRADKISSWDRHDASATFESSNNRWELRAWVRNIADDDIVTGHTVSVDDRGAFRWYFLAEPRIYGASLRYNFGGIH